MRAATNITYATGSGKHQTFAIGDELPDKIVKELPDKLILEKVAESEPESLSREQLMMLAGLGDHPADQPIEYDEGELREALSNLRSKPDVLDWFNTVHPGQTAITHQDDQTREDMVDAIVEELTGE